MRIPYTKFPANAPNRSFFLRPFLQVNLFHGFRSVRTTAHLDTGADQTLVNKFWAEQLGIDWKTGVPFSTVGISDAKQADAIPIYLHKIDIEVINMPNSRRTVEVGFIASKNVNVLLGQIGFFDNFKVSFNLPENFFEIDLNS